MWASRSIARSPGTVGLDPVLVHRLACLLHASFRPRLAAKPLRFAITSPPSGCEEDFHLQAIEHARHTTKSAPIPRSASHQFHFLFSNFYSLNLLDRRHLTTHLLQHLLFPVHQRIDVICRQLKSMPVRDRIGRASFHAIPAENAPRIINVINFRITLACGNPVHVRILRRLNVNAVRRASRRAQKASHALLEARLIAVQHMNPAIPRLEMYRLCG